MILLDYNQIALGVLTSPEFKPQLSGGDVETVKNLVRHATISTILSYKKKYGSKYGQVIIACDGRQYWRREVFPYYKAGRKKSRDNSDLNWKLIFDCLSEMRSDIKDVFPYPVIHIDRAEADDVIAVLTEWAQNNELIEQGLETEPQPILIVSSDKDFKQLHLYHGVKQWSPIQKKFVSATKKEIQEYKIQHIVKGDTGDGIPNLLSQDNVLITEGERQKPVSAKRLAEFIEQGKDACRTDEERRNWDRNEILVSFSRIPEDLKETIIQEYIQTQPKVDRNKIMNYLIKNKCRLLLNNLEEF
jgi:hypothetical protein